MISQYFIYGILDTRKDKLGQLRYIGKSQQGVSRFKDHLKPSSLKNRLKKDCWIQKILDLGLQPEFIILEEYDNPEVLFEEEIFYIAYFKSLGCNLLNMTIGGDGTHGYKHKEETKDKIGKLASIRNKGKPLPEGMKKAIKNIEVDGNTYKQCCKCKQNKELNQFTVLKSRDYPDNYCKQCRAEICANHRKKNPTPKLSKEAFLESHQKAIRAGGEASKRPERRLQASLQRSKPIKGEHIETGEVVTFSSALKAKEAGFHNVNIGKAISSKKPYKDYIWTFIL